MDNLPRYSDADTSNDNPCSPPGYGLLSTIGITLLLIMAVLLGCEPAQGQNLHRVPHADAKVPTHIDLHVVTALHHGAMPAPSATLSQQVRGLLGRQLRTSPGLELSPGPWTVELSVLDLSVRQQLVGTGYATRTVEVFREVSNPQLPALYHRLDQARHEQRRAEHRAKEHWDAFRWLVAKHRETGEAKYAASIPKYERQARNSERLMNQARQATTNAERELRLAPRLVTVSEPAIERYRVETHRQTGSITALMSLLDGDGRIIDQQTITAHRTEEADAVPPQWIASGRHGSSLPHQPPIFTAEHEVTGHLIASAADQAADLVRRAARP